MGLIFNCLQSLNSLLPERIERIVVATRNQNFTEPVSDLTSNTSSKPVRMDVCLYRHSYCTDI